MSEEYNNYPQRSMGIESMHGIRLEIVSCLLPKAGKSREVKCGRQAAYFAIDFRENRERVF